MIKQDRRFIQDVELRTSADDSILAINARAVKYGALSLPGVPVAGGRETIQRGAFKQSIAEGNDVLALYNHSTAAQDVLGRVSNGTLKLQDSPDALNFSLRLDPKIESHRRIHQLVKDQTIAHCSFGFIPTDEGWSNEKDENGRSYALRTVKAAKLCDVSLVLTPAYADGATMAQARSLAYRVNDSVQNANTDAELRRRAALYAEDIRLQGVTDPNAKCIVMRQLPGTTGVKNLRAYRDYEAERNRIPTTEELRKKLEAQRAGFGFEVASEQGQAGDPQQTLRCGASSTTSSRQEHRDASKIHRSKRDHAKTADGYSWQDDAMHDHEIAGDSPDAGFRAEAAIRCAQRCGRVSK